MNTDRLDWSLVRSFLAVVDRGSLLAAAKQLGTYQPTLSRHIAQLEEQLGAALFERTGRGLVPTAAGRSIVEAARRMQSAAQALKDDLRGVTHALPGSVRISASDVVAHYLMPRCIADLRASYPEIQIDLVASNLVSNLLRREADIALRMVRPTQAFVVARRIAQCPLGAFAATSYLERRGRPVRAADLLRHDLIGMDADDTLIRGLQQAGLAFSREQFALRTDDQVLYTRLVEAGAGIGFLAHFAARALQHVVPLLPTLSAPSMPLWLVTHRELHSSAVIRAVYDHLAAELPRLLGEGRL